MKAEKNLRVRKAMAGAGFTQVGLAKHLGISEAAMSIILSRELAKSEQDDLIRKIKEAKA